MNKIVGIFIVFLFIGVIFIIPDCGRHEKVSGIRSLQTNSGQEVWDTSGTKRVVADTYLDRGETQNAILVDAANQAVLRLTGPRVPVKAGSSFSFRFDLRSEKAIGDIFKASLEFIGREGNSKGDSLLYSISAEADEDHPGWTRPWMSYTRALKIPENVTEVRIKVSVSPARGKVWLGGMSFLEGEGWLAYAATFSSHLGRQPQDKYVYTAVRNIEPMGVPQPTEEEKKSGLLFFERKGMVGAWPYANPREGDRVELLYEKVPRGTVAPFVFGVKALEDLSGVNASLSGPLAGKDGELKTKPILYQGRYVATRQESSWSKIFNIRTRLLEAPQAKPLSRGENTFFWLDIPVPENTPPGVYDGEFTVSAQAHTPLKVPFRLEVHPVTLPPIPGDYTLGMYYYPPDDPALIEAQFKDMAAHGVHAVSLAGAFVEKSPAGAIRLDLNRVRQLDVLMALMRKYGFYRPTSLYVADLLRRLDLPNKAGEWTEEYKNLYQYAVRLMDDTARQRGWTRLMFFAVDEPANDPEHMKLALLTHQLLRSMKGIKTICDLNTPGSVEELAPYLDAIVIQISSISPSTIGFTKSKGLQTFFYLPALGSSDVGTDAAYHRSIPGWFLPRSGADGIYYFAYQAVEKDPYDELDGGHRDWCAAYPAEAPYYVWPSPEWQGIRRGIEDLRLVVLARQLIEQCKAGPNEAARQRGEEARAKLEGILNTVKPSGPEVIYQLHNELETYVSEKWRQELLGEVSALQEAMRGK